MGCDPLSAGRGRADERESAACAAGGSYGLLSWCAVSGDATVCGGRGGDDCGDHTGECSGTGYGDGVGGYADWDQLEWCCGEAVYIAVDGLAAWGAFPESKRPAYTTVYRLRDLDGNGDAQGPGEAQMGTGEALTGAEPAAEDLPDGAVTTASGRVSAAADAGDQAVPDGPFSPSQLARLDDALTLVSRHTGLPFSIYLGDLGSDSRGRAESLHDELASGDAVLVAVDPGGRRMSIVTGPHAKTRLPDRACHLAVMSMTASFSEGDLLGGLLSGLRMLSDQAGRSH